MLRLCSRRGCLLCVRDLYVRTPCPCRPLHVPLAGHLRGSPAPTWAAPPASVAIATTLTTDSRADCGAFIATTCRATTASATAATSDPAAATAAATATSGQATIRATSAWLHRGRVRRESELHNGTAIHGRRVRVPLL